MTNLSPKTQRLLTLSMLKGVGPSTLRRVIDIPSFDILPIEHLAREIPPLLKSLAEPGAWDQAIAISALQAEEAKRFDARILSTVDPDYSPLLAATKDDPILIWVRGRLPTDQAKSVAIIGTREPTDHGAVIAQRITAFFVDAGWSIVSGLALGCDGIAHQAALDAGGHTVAVLAHGLHMVAPARHRKLADQILTSGGALISEYRFGQSAQPQQFVKRDRTQAGMAQGVVMIQSDLRGGSLHASRAALNYQRWLAVPYPTAKDLGNHEPKIQANLLIAEGSVEQKKELLHCSGSDLERTIVLRSKKDYSQLIIDQSVLPISQPSQMSFL